MYAVYCIVYSVRRTLHSVHDTMGVGLSLILLELLYHFRFGDSYLLKIQMSHDYTPSSKERLISTLTQEVANCTCDMSYGATVSPEAGG